ncbi:MAG: DUF1549 domain-containing protein, partial [Verrucomicrobia bacterium]|nr:DUF1549 domain-containing protein [Verrucomicrobiota bacterium]
MRFPLLVAVSAAVLARAADAPLPDKVEFNRDIRPIMSDTCFHCHGFDAKSREAGLRLDIRAEALKKTKSDVLPIVPGKPDDSEIIGRIFDEDDPMPPIKAHKPLTERQKALMKRWVEQGAVYEPHWAYAPLRRPVIPAAGAKQNPIDYFIGAKLAEKGLTFSPQAPAERLLRRVSLDLTGLPPTPEDVASYTRDRSRDAYAKAVERSLGSLHYGERMAVWWLDVARFADTVGFHGDQNQRIFPYRDYVINAFNTNKRFDQFTLEQLAGDLLPHPTPEQLVATGYNRLNMMTREGGAQPKEYLAKYGAERVRSVAAAWFGSTFGCAECHDHKFDPIKTRDFYELQSFFADVKQWGVYANYGYTPEPELIGVNNESPFLPEIEVESPYLKKQATRAQAELAAHLKALREKQAKDPAVQPALAAWSGEARSFLATHSDGWMSPTPAGRIVKAGKPVGKRTPVIGADGSIAVDKVLGSGTTLEVTLDPKDLPRLAAVRIEVVPKRATEAAGETDAEGEKPEMIRVNALTFSLNIAGADGKRRKIAIAAGDATAKRPAYRGGAEIPGVADEWRLPLAATAGPVRAVWLPAAPVELAPGEKIVLSL